MEGHKLKLLIFILVMSFSFFSFAQEGAESAAPSSDSVSPEVREWTKHTQKLTGFESKVKENKEELERLIRAKKSGKTQFVDEKGNKISILDSIVETHKNLMEAHENYEQERNVIKYRYPGAGEQIERRYMPLRPPSLEQVELEVGLNGQLTEIKQKTDLKYAKFRKEARSQGQESSNQNQHSLKPKKTLSEPPRKRLKLSQ